MQGGQLYGLHMELIINTLTDMPSAGKIIEISAELLPNKSHQYLMARDVEQISASSSIITLCVKVLSQLEATF